MTKRSLYFLALLLLWSCDRLMPTPSTPVPTPSSAASEAGVDRPVVNPAAIAAKGAIDAFHGAVDAVSNEVAPSEKTMSVGTPVETVVMEALEEEAPAVPSYNPEGKRDPFRSLIKVEKEKKVPDPSLPPLQRIELREIRLTGIAWGGFGYEALMQTPDGKGYGAKIGTRIGTNQGIVSRITSKALTVEERSTDILGKVHVASHVMELHPTEEGVE
jgi:type IV pilus assembly protein PilP